MATRPRTGSTAPILPFDYPAALGEEISACPFCSPWRLELFQDVEHGCLMVREWHAVDCEVWSIEDEPGEEP